MKEEKKYSLLLVIFVISIVIANVVGSRVITTGIKLGPIEISTSGGAITYAFTFLATDVVGELWGKEKAKRMVMYGFVGQVFAMIMIFFTGLCTAVDPTIDNAYNVLLGTSWIFVVGSLCAYTASQTWDVFVFHKVREHFDGNPKMRWIWNNASTMTSQVIDTFMYAMISFGIGMGWAFHSETRIQLLGIMIGQYLLKACLALIDTPFFYALTSRRTKENI